MRLKWDKENILVSVKETSIVRKSNKKDLIVSIKLKSAEIFMVIIGFVDVVACTLILKLPQSNFWKEHFIFKIILDIFNVVGTTILSAGLVSVVLEVSTIKKYVSDALKNVLNTDFPLDSYSDKNLSILNKKIAAKLGKVNEEFIVDSIYKLEENLIELLDGLYYKYYNTK